MAHRSQNIVIGEYRSNEIQSLIFVADDLCSILAGNVWCTSREGKSQHTSMTDIENHLPYCFQAQ